MNSFIPTQMMRMKTVFFVCLMMLFAETSFAQTLDTIPAKHMSSTQKQKRYLQYIHIAPNLSYGNFYIMPGFEFALMNKYNWGLSLEIKSRTANAKNLPADFEPYGFIIFGDGIPDDKSTLILLSAIREFKLKSLKISSSLQTGFSYTEREYPDHFIFEPASGSWFSWGDTYDYEYVTSKTIGLYLKPSVKYLFSKNIAVSLAPWTVLQQRNSYYGIELGFQFGKLR